MRLSKKEVEKIAELARIELTGAEVKKLSSELSQILDYFEKLKEVDTSSVDLDLAESENTNVTREDKAILSDKQEKILKNAPSREGRYYKVKSVL